MSKIFFTKMTGAGNDFIFIDRKKNPDVDLKDENIRKLCNRRFGIGADGLILIDDTSGYDYKMSYFNSDGLAGSLCANGARCSIRFAQFTKRLKNNNASFVVDDIKYSGKIIDDKIIQFNLNTPKDIFLNKELRTSDRIINFSFVNTGSHHVVVKMDDIFDTQAGKKISFNNISEIPVYQLGKEIRYHDQFNPDGTNVNFIQIKEDVIYIRTYERGVEDETLACGTGSVASAIILHLSENFNPPITLRTFGGDNLIVNFSIVNQNVENLTITGPAIIVFEGTVNRDLFF